MTRLLMVHPSLDPPGGGNCVAAWAIEGLRDTHEITLFAWKRPDLDRVNRYFGTSLEPDDFDLRLISPLVRRAVTALPLPSQLLVIASICRATRSLLRREHWDVVLGTQNEMDFGRPGIQYVHFPTFYEPRPACDLRWYHRRFPFALRAYRRFGRFLALRSEDAVRRNLSLVNSRWTGERMTSYYGAETTVLFPPVPGDFPRRTWQERRDGFVCIGRFAPEKELEKVIEILARVRRGGRQVDLHLVGNADHADYTARVLAAAESAGPWVHIHFDLPRVELVELVARNRYGIHGMVDEHFGIAVAELQRSGAPVFVPDGGGPVEIVGGDERLIYHHVADAVAKIDRVLADPELARSMHLDALARAEHFTTERFNRELSEIVATFADGGNRDAPT